MPAEPRAGHFRRDVVLNPNKSNLTVAMCHVREPERPRARRKDEEIDRAIVTKIETGGEDGAKEQTKGGRGQGGPPK